jgi:dephospho-CoA kinase
LIRRDGVPAAQVEARMAAQLSDEEYEVRADIVIRNDGDLAALQHAAEEAWARLVRLRGDGQKPPDASR